MVITFHKVAAKTNCKKVEKKKKMTEKWRRFSCKNSVKLCILIHDFQMNLRNLGSSTLKNFFFLFE